MALVATPDHWLPYKYPAAGNLQTITLDAASESGGCIFSAPSTGSITKLWWRTGTVTTGCNVDVRLETVSATTGLPTGTLQGTTTNATVTIAATDDDKLFKTTLTAAASVTHGDVLAIVIVNDPTTPGNFILRRVTSTFGDYNSNTYGFQAVPTAAKLTDPILFAIEYSTGVVVTPGGYVLSDTVTAMSASTSLSAGNEQGNRIVVPMKARCAGVQALRIGDSDTFIFKLYNSSDTEIATSLTLDGDQFSVISGIHSVIADWVTPVTIDAGAVVRVVMQANAVQQISEFAVNVAGDLDAWIMGANCYKTARASTGVGFTDTTTARTYIALRFDQMDDGAGGAGGLLTHPGMGGGLRG